MQLCLGKTRLSVNQISTPVILSTVQEPLRIMHFPDLCIFVTFMHYAMLTVMHTCKFMHSLMH